MESLSTYRSYKPLYKFYGNTYRNWRDSQKVKIIVSTISQRIDRSGGSAQSLLAEYLERSTRYAPTSHRAFPIEAALLTFLDGAAARTRPHLLLTDSTGQQVSSTELATHISQLFDSGQQTLVLAIGPADGWSTAARQRADKTIAFGRITLPHELAAVVAAEQLYRALTIRTGHPYHSGH
jgi:23S rRNA (pseudouridine1915-N3)-methyltransferase